MPRTVALPSLAVLAVISPGAAQEMRRLEVPPEVRSQVAALIRNHRMNCPDLKEAAHAGEDSKGINYRVVCGKVGGAPDPALTFRVTNSGGTVTVQAWK